MSRPSSDGSGSMVIVTRSLYLIRVSTRRRPMSHGRLTSSQLYHEVPGQLAPDHGRPTRPAHCAENRTRQVSVRHRSSLELHHAAHRYAPLLAAKFAQNFVDLCWRGFFVGEPRAATLASLPGGSSLRGANCTPRPGDIGGVREVTLRAKSKNGGFPRFSFSATLRIAVP